MFEVDLFLFYLELDYFGLSAGFDGLLGVTVVVF